MVSLNTNALTTTGAVETELGLSSGGAGDAEKRWINEASDLFEKLTGRRFYNATGHTERVAGYGREAIFVDDHRPVSTINSITYDTGNTTETINADDYELIDGDAGKIRKINGVWRHTARNRTNIATHADPGSEEKLLKVDYDGGYITPKQDNDGVGTRDLPYDIERAALEFVAMRSAQQGANTAVSSVSVGKGSIDYVTGPGGGRIAVPPAFKSAVHRYYAYDVA